MAKFRDTVKVFFFMGYLVGTLPRSFFALEVLGNRIGKKSRFTKLTSLYSGLYWTALILLAGECTLAFARSMEDPSVSKLTGTNLTAFRILINLVVHFIMVVSVVGIVYSGRMSRMVLAIAEYDDQFRMQNTTRIATPNFIMLLVVFMSNVIIEGYKTNRSMLIMWNEEKSCSGISAFPWIDFKIRLVLTIVIPHVLVKVGVFVILASIGILTDAVTDRINRVTREIVSTFPMLNELQNQDGSLLPSGNGNNNEYGEIGRGDPSAILQACSLRLANLKWLTKQLQRWSGLIILVVIAIKIVELVASIYLGTLTMLSILYFELRQDPLVLLVPAIVGFIILFVVVEAGERLVNAETELRESVYTIDTQRIRDDILKEQLVSFQNLVSNSRFRLTACNFFDVNRKLLASMVGPLVTFVVVLAQFRMSDRADE